MKKIILFFIIISITILGYLSFDYYKETNTNENPIIDTQKVNNNDITPETGKYIDNNPIKLGLYKYHGRYTDRELITEFSAPWQYHTDISSFEVYFTNESTIPGSNQIEQIDTYKTNYENIENYRIGYIINFLTNEKEIHKTILSPKDSEDFFEYLEIYLYDDYHRTPGVWYSHTTEEEFNENTLLTSIKLTAGVNVSQIISDITLTAFTYDSNDFDNYGNYKGISKYTIIVKKSN